MSRDGDSADVSGLVAAQSETLYRRVNERILDLSRGSELRHNVVSFVCECGDPACSRPLELTPAEYEAVRTDPLHFVVAVGHEEALFESIALETDRYLVVEMRGAGRQLAVDSDPRRHRSG